MLLLLWKRVLSWCHDDKNRLLWVTINITSTLKPDKTFDGHLCHYTDWKSRGKHVETILDAGAEVKSQSNWKRCFWDVQYPRETPLAQAERKKNHARLYITWKCRKNTDLAEFTHRRIKYASDKSDDWISLRVFLKVLLSRFCLKIKYIMVCSSEGFVYIKLQLQVLTLQQSFFLSI